jgi:hypothetical protein
MSRQPVELIEKKFLPKNVTPQTDALPHVYLALPITNVAEVDDQWLEATGCRYRCVNFAYVYPGAFYYAERAKEAYVNSLRRKVNLMMDSSAFSFHNYATKQQAKVGGTTGMFKGQTLEQMREIVVQQYVTFCKKHAKYWDFYATFDYVKNCEKIYAMTKRLESYGLKPAPLYHGDSSLEWLHRYCKEGYKYIGIGTIPVNNTSWRSLKDYYSRVFDVVSKYKDVKTHGFGLTKLSFAFMFDWTSIDSSSWSRASAYGCVYFPDFERGKMNAVQVSSAAGHRKNPQNAYQALSPSVQKEVRRKVEERGYNFELLQISPSYRFMWNGYIFSHLHDFKEVMQAKVRKWGRLF